MKVITIVTVMILKNLPPKTCCPLSHEAEAYEEISGMPDEKGMTNQTSKLDSMINKSVL